MWYILKNYCKVNSWQLCIFWITSSTIRTAAVNFGRSVLYYKDTRTIKVRSSFQQFFRILGFYFLLGYQLRNQTKYLKEKFIFELKVD